jgi:hypothetical protein
LEKLLPAPVRCPPWYVKDISQWLFLQSTGFFLQSTGFFCCLPAFFFAVNVKKIAGNVKKIAGNVIIKAVIKK